MGNDFKTAPRSTFDIVYEKSRRFVLFHTKEGQHTPEKLLGRKAERILIPQNRVYEYAYLEYGDTPH